MHEHKNTEENAEYELYLNSDHEYINLNLFNIHLINDIFIMYELDDEYNNIPQSDIIEYVELFNDNEKLEVIDHRDAPTCLFVNYITDRHGLTEKQTIYKISLNCLINRLIILKNSRLRLKLKFNNKNYKLLNNIKIIMNGIKYDNINEVIAEPLTITYTKKTVEEFKIKKGCQSLKHSFSKLKNHVKCEISMNNKDFEELDDVLIKLNFSKFYMKYDQLIIFSFNECIFRVTGTMKYHYLQTGNIIELIENC